LVLQPLDDAAVAQVIRNLLGGAGLPDAFIAKVVAAAEGNPLYVEQMLQMLIDSGAVKQEDDRWVAAKAEGDISIPPTIQALLEARLDKLERGERAAAEPASVIGMEFQRPAVQALAAAPIRESIDDKLQGLSRKHFIRTTIGTEGDARYRFDHHMVRETVYNGLLKRARATMHAEFVKWADQANAGSDRGREFEEILGYHLEQAYKYLGELGPIDEQGAAIGCDGSRRLASAARRAFGRGDLHAAASLFKRASGLRSSEDPERSKLLPELAEALMAVGKFPEARAALGEAMQAAERTGDQRLRAFSIVVGHFIGLLSRDGATSNEEVLRTTQELIPILEDEQANYELATAWRLITTLHGISGRYRLASDACDKTLAYARLAANDRLIARVALNVALNCLLGPTPVAEGIAQCERLIAEGLSDRRIEAIVMCKLAQLRAMKGDLDVARKLYVTGRAVLRDIGRTPTSAGSVIELLQVELHGGDLALAEREAREDYEFLKQIGETYNLSTAAALLARVVREQGRDDDALAFSEVAENEAAPHDFESQALWRSVRAPILARRGNLAEAEDLARAAVSVVREAEAPHLIAEVLVEFASVLQLVGKIDMARTNALEAIELFKSKGCDYAVERWGAWVARL
jgi:tetratricopeptide (TPR) repeat protein